MRRVHDALVAAREVGAASVDCSLDLGRMTTTVAIGATAWYWQEAAFP